MTQRTPRDPAGASKSKIRPAKGLTYANGTVGHTVDSAVIADP